MTERRSRSFGGLAAVGAVLLLALPVAAQASAPEGDVPAGDPQSADAPPPAAPSAPPSADDQSAGAPPSGNAQDLAKQLSNPIASLISFPFQQNIEGGYGPDGDGVRITTNIQPVVPIPISDRWNMISRTILPVIYQADVTGASSSEFGLGDVTQSLFFSPSQTGPSGIIWGAGPAFLIPTATDKALGTGKWGVGPTIVILKQAGPTTFGALANHIWSVAGSDNRGDVSSTFMQPFLSYTTPSATTFSVNSETSYNWLANQWLVPVSLQISQLTHMGKQPIQVGTGLKYYLESPDGGPNWGIRFTLTFLFPKK